MRLYEDFEDGDYAGWELLEDATQPVAVVDELGADNGTSLYFVLTEDVADTTSAEAAFILFNGSGEQVYAIDQYWVDFVPDQWQEVELWFDWKLHTHDLYINGEMIVEGAPFNSEHIGEVVIYAGGGGLFGYFDEIRVR